MRISKIVNDGYENEDPFGRYFRSCGIDALNFLDWISLEKSLSYPFLDGYLKERHFSIPDLSCHFDGLVLQALRFHDCALYILTKKINPNCTRGSIEEKTFERQFNLKIIFVWI